MEIHPQSPLIFSSTAPTDRNIPTNSSIIQPQPLLGKMGGKTIIVVPTSPQSVEQGITTPDTESPITIDDHTITRVAQKFDQNFPTNDVEPFAFPRLKKIDDPTETCSSVADDDDWKSVSSDDFGDTWKEVTTADASAASLEEKKFLKLAQQFSEEPNARNGNSFYANISIRDGADLSLVQAFESYRNKAIQAYHEGKTQTAIAWAKIAEGAQGSIACSIEAMRHSPQLDNIYSPTEGALGICYNAAAQAMGNYAQHQAEFLTTQALLPQDLEQVQLGHHAENQWLQASLTYDQAIHAFKKGDRKTGERFQFIADSHQRAADYLSKQFRYTEQANSAQLPKEKKRYQTMAAQSAVKATEMIEAAQRPLQGRLAQEKQELLKTVSRFVAEPKTINGRSSYANNAIKQGVPVPLVRAFESYRHKAVQAYREGKTDDAAQWAKIAEDAQESIDYYIKAFQHDTRNSRFNCNVFRCYRDSANAMHEYVQSQTEFLTTYKNIPQSDTLMSLGVQAEHQFCESVATYARAIKAFQQGDSKMGAALQEVASRQRQAGHYLSKYIACSVEQQGGNFSAELQQKTFDYSNKAIEMLQGLWKAVHDLAEED